MCQVSAVKTASPGKIWPGVDGAALDSRLGVGLIDQKLNAITRMVLFFGLGPMKSHR